MTFDCGFLSKTRYYYCFLGLLAVLYILFFSYSTSPLYSYCSSDSGIFQQMGSAILKGKVPYLDLFDHKGCVLYFIQALGLWLGGKAGLCVLQALCAFACLVLVDKIIRFFLDEIIVRTIIIVMFMLGMAAFGLEGNLTEFWSMPFILFPIYLFSLSHFKRIEIKYGYVLIGICIGIISFIRVNNCFPFVVMLAFDMLDSVIHKRYLEFFKKAFYLFIGIVSVVLLCCAVFYFMVGMQGVNALFYGTFGANFEYAETPDFLLFSFCRFNCCSIIALFIFMLHYRKDTYFNIILILSICLSFFVFGARNYGHYLTLCLPLYLFAIIYILKYRLKLGYVCMILLLTVFFLLIYRDNSLARTYNNYYRTNHVYERYDDFIASISNEDRDSFYNYNAGFEGVNILQHCGIVQMNRIMLPSNCNDMPTLKREEAGKTLEKSRPEYILLLPKGAYYNDVDSIFIVQHYILTSILPSYHNDIYVCRKNFK